MAKAGRRKAPIFSKVTKKDSEWKAALIDNVKETARDYKNIFVCEVHNDNNNSLSAVREALKVDDKGIMKNLGKGKAKVALRDLKNIEKLFAHMTGRTCLIFTDLTKNDLQGILDQHKVSRPASSGAKATETVVLKAGYEALEGFPHTLEERFRELGLPTKLDDGRILLLGDYEVCKEGKNLSPNSALILKHLGYEMAEFKVVPKALYTKKNGKVEVL